MTHAGGTAGRAAAAAATAKVRVRLVRRCRRSGSRRVEGPEARVRRCRKKAVAVHARRFGSEGKQEWIKHFAFVFSLKTSRLLALGTSAPRAVHKHLGSVHAEEAALGKLRSRVRGGYAPRQLAPRGR